MCASSRYFEWKAAGLCRRCGKKPAPQSVYCRLHRDEHRERQREAMRRRRAADPVYVELERYALRLRMRKLRAQPDYVRPD